MKQSRIVAYGELLWDILPTETVLGGALFNLAYRVNELGDVGIPVTRVGVDPLGREAVERVQALGMNTDYVQQDQLHPTGTVHVRLDDSNNPDFFIVPDVAYDYIQFDRIPADLLGADCVCFGTLIQRSTVSRETLYNLLSQSPQALKFLDINLRRDCYSIETVRTSLEYADILKMNENEVWELKRMLELQGSSVPDLAESVQNRFSLEAVLVTLGDRGVFSRSARGRAIYIPGYRVAVVDSVGAGDAFSAGFLHSWLQGTGLEEACDFGNRLGALVATLRGGTTPLAKEALESFAAGHLERNIDRDLHP